MTAPPDGVLGSPSVAPTSSRSASRRRSNSDAASATWSVKRIPSPPKASGPGGRDGEHRPLHRRLPQPDHPDDQEEGEPARRPQPEHPGALLVAAAWPLLLAWRAPEAFALWRVSAWQPIGDPLANLRYFLSTGSWFAFPGWLLGAWAVTVEVYHESSHLGDEYEDRFDAKRVDWTREGEGRIEVLGARETVPIGLAGRTILLFNDWKLLPEPYLYGLAAARLSGIVRESYLDGRFAMTGFAGADNVTFDGTDHVGAGPDLPYASKHRTHYSATKAEAEKLVLGAEGVRAVALRPHLIWGPGDPFIFPGVIERHREGKLARIGGGENRVDITYVDNAAAAHVHALDALVGGANGVAGRAFFISDGEPVALWPFLDELFAALDLPPLRRRVPAGVAFAAGAVLETAHRVLRLEGEPRMTRFLAQQVSTSHWYDMAPAGEALGYEPVVARAEAWARTVEDLRARGLCGRGGDGLEG